MGVFFSWSFGLEGDIEVICILYLLWDVVFCFLLNISGLAVYSWPLEKLLYSRPTDQKTETFCESPVFWFLPLECGSVLDLDTCLGF